MAHIYKITNTINGKSYIGQTIKPISARWYYHIYCSENKLDDLYFHRAIRKYGADKFTIEEIEECSQDELDAREVYWIDYFDTFNNGYNLTVGGCGKKIIDTNTVYRLWDDGLSVLQISKKLNRNRTAILNILSDYDNYSPFEGNRRGSHQKPVLMCDKDGNVLRKYNSIIDAKRKTGLSHIGECCRNARKTDGGYVWRYEQDEHCPTTFTSRKTKSVKCVETGVIYDSANYAERTLGITHIVDCCRGKRKTAGGFTWVFCQRE